MNSVTKLPYRPNHYDTNAADRLLWGRKHDKAQSSDDSEIAQSSAGEVGLSARTRADRYLIEKYFRSMYRSCNDAEDEDDCGDISRAFYIKEPVDFSPRFTEPPREVIRASKRFFTSPGLASSLVEEARLSAASSSATPRPSDVTAVSCGDSTAVVMVSRDPYDDFRQSMLEMVTAHHADVGDSREMLDWDFMEELLLRYLELNDRSVHKDVLRAFAHVTSGVDGRRGKW